MTALGRYKFYRLWETLVLLVSVVVDVTRASLSLFIWKNKIRWL